MADHDSTLKTLAIAVALAGTLMAVVHVAGRRDTSALTSEASAGDNAGASTGAIAAAASAKPKLRWVAAAPGRVEPKGGVIKIAARTMGRLQEVLIEEGQQVAADDLLLRLDDEEARARVAAAEAELAARKRDRDQEKVERTANDRRVAEDAVADAEVALDAAHDDFDRALRDRRRDTVAQHVLDEARSALANARKRLDERRTAHQNARRVAGIQAPSKLEAAYTGTHAQLTAARAAFTHTRLRAPSAGTVVGLSAKAGEMVVPSPENVLVSLADLSSMTVKADIEERDVGKIKPGHLVVVRADAFPDKEFSGRVRTLGKVLGQPKAASKGPRKPNDFDVLEAVIDLDGATPLIAGMRVDVYFIAGSEAAMVQATGAPTR